MSPPASGTGSSLSPRPPPNALLNVAAPGILHSGICLRTYFSTKFTIKPRGIPSKSPIRVTSTFFKSVRGSTCCSTCTKFSTMTMAFAPESFS